MKRIILFTIILIVIPFLIVTYLNLDRIEELSEIELNYISNVVVRVYRNDSKMVQDVMLEEYVVGVVAGEMPASFEIEALKAQAVAARTYVLRKILDNEDKEYDVVDTVADQVYLDDDTLREKWGSLYVSYINKVRTAVNETSMEYLDYYGEVIMAMYFSTSNGYTEDNDVIFGSEVPYLVSVDSSWDSEVSSVFQDNTSMSLADFYTDLGLAYQNDLNIENVVRSETGRVKTLTINGYDFTGKDLYNQLGLRSYDFSIELVGSNVLITTKGYGHGVGMSQYGAYGMAIHGYTYDEILSHYYTSTSLKKWEI